MNKKNQVIFLFVIVVVFLCISFASANFFSDLWGKITGKATTGTASVNISVGNSAPTVPFVSALAATDPVIGGNVTLNLTFTATDLNGISDISNATAIINLTKSGQASRSNTSCLPKNASGNSITFNCTVTMWYWDGNGAWTVNATINDSSNALGTNSSTTFTYNLQTAMVMSPTSLTWPAISVSSTNIGSNNDPIIVNNSGNAVSLGVNVTAYNLRGETTSTQFIYANNFSVDNISDGCVGTVMANATNTKVSNASLQSGNNTLNYDNSSSGQEPLDFCLLGVPTGISSQYYSSAAYGAWTVAIG